MDSKRKCSSDNCNIIQKKVSREIDPRNVDQLASNEGTCVNAASQHNLPQSNCMFVSPRQKGNAVLNYIREIRWQYKESLIPDFEFSRSNCAVFLSVRYHNLNPEYIHKRIDLLRNRYSLRILLVHADVSNATNHALRELAKICLFSDLTMIVCSTTQEISLYLEAYKVLENKPPDMLMTPILNVPHLSAHSRINPNDQTQNMQCKQEWIVGRASEFLTGIRSVNATDVKVLLKTFGSVKNIMCAGENDLSVCPGIGPLKMKRICRARELPFRIINEKTLKTHKSDHIIE